MQEKKADRQELAAGEHRYLLRTHCAVPGTDEGSLRYLLRTHRAVQLHCRLRTLGTDAGSSPLQNHFAFCFKFVK